MFFLLLIVLGLLLQPTSGDIYACNQQKDSCGCSSHPVVTAKIIGGELAASHSWSWLVSLRLLDTHFCGGTILNEWFIITAAHCLSQKMSALSNITVCAGIDYLSDICSQNLSVANVTNHHGFNNRTMGNDIALLRLATPLNFSDPFISRICLPNTTHSLDYPETGTAVTAVGWGSTEIGGTVSNELRQITLKILDKSARICAFPLFNSRLQLCAYSTEKDTCRGDSGGPLMAFTASKQWELVGLTSYGRGCANHEYSGFYTRMTVYQEFIESVINGTYTTPTPRKCSCQCPYGRYQGVAYTSENLPETCVDACIAVSSNPCNSYNTYACLGTDCVYSATYIHNCSCQCPFGSNQGFVYTTGDSTEACVNACIAIPSNNCTSLNTYVCLEDNCAYSSLYDNSSATISTFFECSCQCPYGSYQGTAFSKINSTDACVDACRAVSSNPCISSNTYACLGTACTYSSGYVNSSSIAVGSYRCSCQCPYGSDQGWAYASTNSPEACVVACIGVLFNPCNSSNTYACLGTACTYSSGYVNSASIAAGSYRCSCQCPYGSDQGWAYARTNSSEACVDACRAVLSNPCNGHNTYACLGTACTYSSGYVNSSSIVEDSYRCSCQCPYGSDQGWAYANTNSAEACVNACRAVSSNDCVLSNTYACIGTRCAYSSEYRNSLPRAPGPSMCSCQCPYGFDQGVAFTKENSTDACVCACRAVSTNRCVGSNTYACLGTNCVYSSTYNHSLAIEPSRYKCSCQCPYGTDQGWAYATDNSPEACISACIAVSSNPCTSSNTYACLGTACTYSSGYVNSSSIVTDSYRCSCQCPYGSDQGSAYASTNSPEACVGACIAISWNSCTRSNTYACLGTACTYSSGYVNSSPIVMGYYRCSCQCPYGSDQGWAYASTNLPSACVSACIGVSSNRCVSSNTYACLGTACTYSSGYVNTSSIVTGSYRCSCQCPYGSYQSWAYASTNSPEACIDACIAVSSNPCNSYNTYACLGTDCVYSATYIRNCSCQCPFGSNQTIAYTIGNSTEACVNACISVPSNNCIRSNTYACLEDNCTYSSSYNNSSVTVPVRYRCSCYCPHGSYRGVALSKVNLTEACVHACIVSPLNDCTAFTTYACLGTSCAYSSSYIHRSTTMLPRYRCSCQCPYGYDQGIAHTTQNSPEGCVDACQAVQTNPCAASNTYACLGTNCAYSNSYSNTSRTPPVGYKCVCQCPYGSDEGVAYANENSTAACVNACKAVPWNSCDSSNTYACLGTDCVYSNSYIH